MPRNTPKDTADQTDNQAGGEEPEVDAPAAETAAVVEAATADPTPVPETAPEKPQDDTPEAPESPESPEAPAVPEPDEYGRYRVRDEDTGHELTIHAAALPHGRFTVLDEPATDPLTGEPVPVVHKSPVETTTSGQPAENQENLDA